VVLSRQERGGWEIGKFHRHGACEAGGFEARRACSEGIEATRVEEEAVKSESECCVASGRWIAAGGRPERADGATGGLSCKGLRSV